MQVTRDKVHATTEHTNTKIMSQQVILYTTVIFALKKYVSVVVLLQENKHMVSQYAISESVCVLHTHKHIKWSQKKQTTNGHNGKTITDVLQETFLKENGK